MKLILVACRLCFWGSCQTVIKQSLDSHQIVNLSLIAQPMGLKAKFQPLINKFNPLWDVNGANGAINYGSFFPHFWYYSIGSRSGEKNLLNYVKRNWGQWSEKSFHIFYLFQPGFSRDCFSVFLKFLLCIIAVKNSQI